MKRINKESLSTIRFGLLYRKLALHDNSVSELNDLETYIYSSNNQIEYFYITIIAEMNCLRIEFLLGIS